ncbi:MAG: PhzF family phenazine biosynthesis protein [Pseudomonadota bacterium]
MNRERPFKQVDVFTAVALLGNPVAVVLDASGMSDADMQAFANWTNLSETTFVLPSTQAGADYAMRIFTPRNELVFAGHPTLGTAHAVIEAGIAAPKGGKIIQQCKLGLIEVSVGDTGLSLKMPPNRVTPAPDPEGLAAALKVANFGKGAPQVVDVGPHWVIAELDTVEAVETLTPDLPALAAYDRAHHTTGITLFAVVSDSEIIVRTFAPLDGIAEDPVCGSGNGALAAYRLHSGAIKDGDHYLASQGRQVGRDGKVLIRIEGSNIHVGGDCVTCIDGIYRQ